MDALVNISLLIILIVMGLILAVFCAMLLVTAWRERKHK